MNSKNNAIKDFAESIFSKSTQLKYWEHTQRVLKYAIHIAKAERANLDIIIPAVLLHDIGMTVDATFPSHIDKSKLLAQGILKQLEYSHEEIEQITKVITSHHPKPGAMLDSIEEKVMFDADNMEIIGVFGVLRWFGKVPTTLKELDSSIDLFFDIVDKCTKSRGSLFYTEAANKMGSSTLLSTLSYYEKLKEHIKQFEDNIEFPIPIGF